MCWRGHPIGAITDAGGLPKPWNFVWCYSFVCYVGPCQHGMARSHVPDAGDGLQIWRVVASIQWRSSKKLSARALHIREWNSLRWRRLRMSFFKSRGKIRVVRRMLKCFPAKCLKLPPHQICSMGTGVIMQKDESVRQHSREFLLYGASQHPQPQRNEPHHLCSSLLVYISNARRTHFTLPSPPEQ